MSQISVGSTYESFEEFRTALKSYEEQNNVRFYKRNSRTINASRPKVQHYLHPDLVYYELRMCCVFGGPFRKKGCGIRNTSTMRKDCPAQISLRATTDGMLLKVTSLDDEHNHDISKDFADYGPPKRKRKLNKAKSEEPGFAPVDCNTLCSESQFRSISTKKQSALKATNAIADVISMFDDDRFERILVVLKKMKECLLKGIDFTCIPENNVPTYETEDSVFHESSFVESYESFGDNDEDFDDQNDHIYDEDSESDKSVPEENSCVIDLEIVDDSDTEGTLANYRQDILNKLDSLKLPPSVKVQVKGVGQTQAVMHQKEDRWKQAALEKKQSGGEEPVPTEKSKRVEPLPFVSKPASRKEFEILKCIIPIERVRSVGSQLIEEHEVELNPDNVPNKIVDSRIDLFWIKKYFSEKAWENLEQLVALKKKTVSWVCEVCHKKLSESYFICCDYCLEWSHHRCVGLERRPRGKFWMCKKCKVKPSEEI